MPLAPTQGSVWNERDTGFFRVKVSNNGPLPIKKAVLHITGSQFGQVQQSHNRANPSPYVDSFDTAQFDLNSHAPMILGATTPFGFKATKATPGVPPAPAAIITAAVKSFDLTLDHLLIDLTASSPARKVSEMVTVLAA